MFLRRAVTFNLTILISLVASFELSLAQTKKPNIVYLLVDNWDGETSARKVEPRRRQRSTPWLQRGCDF